LILFLLSYGVAYAQESIPATKIPGMKLVWADEFNNNGFTNDSK
jgi:hypothetical protein